MSSTTVFSDCTLYEEAELELRGAQVIARRHTAVYLQREKAVHGYDLSMTITVLVT